MTVALKRNVPGYYDEQGRFRPIRSPQYVGSGTRKRPAKVRDRKKYSRAKAGDLGPARQERALEAPWDREFRLAAEDDARAERDRERIERELESEVYGETSGRTSKGKALSLAQFIRSEGGINTKARTRHGRRKYGDLENFTRKGSGSTGLVTTTPGRGKSADYMHQAARAAGYDVADIDDMLDRLDDEIRSGKKTYSTHGHMTYNPRKKAVVRPARIDKYYVVNDPPSPLYFVKQLGIKGNLHTADTSAKAFAFIARLVKADRKLNPAAKKNPDAYVVKKGTKWIVLDREGRQFGRDLKGRSLSWKTAAGADAWCKKQGFYGGHVVMKDNPDAITMFAGLAGGIASALSIKDHMERRPAKRKPAKRRPAAKRKNPQSAIRNPQSKAKKPKGDLYVLTIGSGDDISSVYLHDGDADGFSKRFRTMAAAKTYATKSKRKLIANPAAAKVNGMISRAWARSKAKREYAKELRLAAAAERSRSRRRKAEAKAKNPKTPTKGTKGTKANPRRSAIGTKAAARSAKANPAWSKFREGLWMFDSGRAQALQLPGGKWRASWINARGGVSHREGVKTAAEAKRIARAGLAPWKSAIRNPKSPAVPRRRTFEMFQGRPATKGREMPVSEHAPARLDQLGDLVELKINGGPTLKFKRGVKLCAANGRLWIAGKRFAKANPAARPNEINPIGEIGHVVYGTHKPHHGDHAYTHYIHKLGEESGRRPILCVDREGFPVIKGGNYKIEARGIVD